MLASQLPNDILFKIFQYFNPDELVKIEMVCRPWFHSARTHKSLWRDGSIYDENRSTICPIKYYKRFKSLTERNGGRFTKLFLNICLMSLTDDDIRKLLADLPFVVVSDLWIVIGLQRQCPADHMNCFIPYLTPSIFKGTRKRIEEVITALLKVLIKSTKLTKLRISSSVDIGKIDLIDCGNPAEWPINQCKLEELHLIRLRYDILFPKEVNHQILSNARSITLSYGGKSNKEDENRFWHLIETAKETLEYCFVERLNDVPHHIAEAQPIRSYSSRRRKVLFPALKSFSTNFDDGLEDRFNDEVDILDYSMVCPILENLNVSTLTPNSMLQDLITEQIKFLSVGVRNENQTILNESFKNCKQLETLRLWHQPYSEGIYRQMAESTKQMPLKELSVKICHPDVAKDLLRFLESRDKKVEANKIQTLSFLYQDTSFPRAILTYLHKFVEEIKIYSQPPNPEFIKILEEHNGFFVFEQGEDESLI